MSGYNTDRGMSNNAVLARSEGKYPASIVAKRLGVPSKFITENAPVAEWHHVGTGARFNAVRSCNFYSIEECREWLAEVETQLALEGFRAAQKIIKVGKGERIIAGCTFVWHTSNGLRKWHKMIEHSVDGCMIHDNGSALATVYFPDGSTARKNLSGNWVKVIGGEVHMDKISRRIAGFKAAVSRRQAKLAAEREARRATEDVARAATVQTVKFSNAKDLAEWKSEGFPHPAPSFVVNAKHASGLTWNEFQASL